MSLLNDRMEEIYQERQKTWENTFDEDYYAASKTWAKEIDILCEDMDDTIRYLNEECPGYGFAWISEVMEDVAERTQSLEFVETLYKLAEKYPEETKEYNIMTFVNVSRDCLKQFWD